MKSKLKLLYVCCPYLRVLFKETSENHENDFMCGLSDKIILKRYKEVKKEMRINPQIKGEIGRSHICFNNAIDISKLRHFGILMN